MQDAARDALDALDVPDGVFSVDFSFQGARRELIDRAKAEGFETLDESYTRISTVAQKLGVGEAYTHFNRLLSKFAHPTALVVIHGAGSSEPVLRGKFHALGIGIARDSLQFIQRILGDAG